MINPIQKFETNTTSNTIKEEPSSSGGFLNLDFFKDPNSAVLPCSGDMTVEEKPKKKRGRKKSVGDADKMIKAEPSGNQSELPMYQTNEPYKNTYNETDNLLRGSIIQIDKLQNDVNQQLDLIKGSKTLKRKYDYITNLTASASNLISTRVAVIREMNKTISDCHNLELKRIKDLKLNEKDNEVDDDKRLMDMYNAFISTPINQQLAPSITDMSFMSGTGLVRADVGEVAPQSGPMSPTANMMRLELNPDVKTVVMYDASTGNRWFDVINVKTGESIPNVDKPDAMFLEDTTLDVRNGIARNTNLDTTYDLVVLNNQNLYEY